MDNPFLVEVTRGNLVESRHRGSVSVVDAEGATVLSIGDIDGEANSYTGYQLRLGFNRFSQDYRIMLKLGIGWDDYDDKHPIFGKTRNDTKYSAFGMFTLSDLFGKDYLFGNLLAGYQYRDSNIGFLNAKTFLSGPDIGCHISHDGRPEISF